MEAVMVPIQKRFSFERVCFRVIRVVKSVVKHTILISVAISCVFRLCGCSPRR